MFTFERLQEVIQELGCKAPEGHMELIQIWARRLPFNASRFRCGNCTQRD